MAGCSFSDIARAHAQKRDFEKQYPASRYLFRPVSFLSAWLLLKVTRSPSLVAFWGLAAGMAACAALAAIPEWGPWPGILLLVAYDILDGSDGVVARATGNVTYYGRFLDGVIGEMVEGTAFLALGLGLYRDQAGLPFGLFSAGESAARHGPFLLFAAGAAVLCGRLYAGHVMRAYYEYREKARGGAASAAVTDTVQSSRHRSSLWYLLYANLGWFDTQMVLLICSAAAGQLPAYLLLQSGYYLLQSGLHTVYYLRLAGRTLT